MQAGETQIAKYKVSPLIRLSAVKNDQQIICSHTKCCSIANSGGNETPGDPGLTIESLRTLASSTKLKVGHSFTECPKYTKALHNGVSVGMKDKRAFRFLDPAADNQKGWALWSSKPGQLASGQG